MQKGFTLVELLIVVVIVGVMVAIALPQYKRATERGRMMEGIANLRAVTDYMNAQYVLNDFSYPSTVNTGNMDLVQSRYFLAPAVSVSNSNNTVEVTMTRNTSSGWNYRFSSRSDNGELTSSACTNLGTSDDCKAIGFPTVNGTATPLL